MGTREARWVLLATVLGSGVAFLHGMIVNVALPVIARERGDPCLVGAPAPSTAVELA